MTLILFKDVLTLKKFNFKRKQPVSGKRRNFLFPVLIAVFAIIFLVSGGILADYFMDSQQQQSQMEELNDIVEQVQQEMQAAADNAAGTPGEPLTTYTEVVDPDTGEKITLLREYAKLYTMNTDLVGWIKIDGTHVNNPVMQTPQTENFYLKRDFYGKESRHGSIYVAERARLDIPSDNVIIYGHRMADGTMFADLHNYREKTFFDEHPLIKFDTLTEHHTYQICYIFIMSASEDKAFAYHTFTDGNEAEFNAYVATCKQMSLYDTGAEPVYGDKLITLSTCDHNIKDGRLVVVARRID